MINVSIFYAKIRIKTEKKAFRRQGAVNGRLNFYIQENNRKLRA